MVALPRIIVKRWPGAGVDVLVNNAGLGRNNAALWDGSTASWVEMISTNVLGVCMATREALKARHSVGEGRVGVVWGSLQGQALRASTCMRLDILNLILKTGNNQQVSRWHPGCAARWHGLSSMPAL